MFSFVPRPLLFGISFPFFWLDLILTFHGLPIHIFATATVVVLWSVGTCNRAYFFSGWMLLNCTNCFFSSQSHISLCPLNEFQPPSAAAAHTHNRLMITFIEKVKLKLKYIVVVIIIKSMMCQMRWIGGRERRRAGEGRLWTNRKIQF